jgi:hypothetical protein
MGGRIQLGPEESRNAFTTVHVPFLFAAVAFWWSFDRVTPNLADPAAAGATAASLSSDGILLHGFQLETKSVSVSVRYPYLYVAGRPS